MADVQVNLKLPVLRLGSAPESERDFGPSTDQSVKHYQQNENLTVDGIVGKQTWTSLLCAVGTKLNG
jgi:peptidoglycan hydrolase-like protein with peptidoglycan-binding domain